VLAIDLLRQQLDCVLIWDVFDHKSGPLVRLYGRHLDLETARLVVALLVVHWVALLVVRIVAGVLVVG